MNKETIERYLNNRCTEEEKEVIQRWMHQEGGNWFDKYFDEQYHNGQGQASVVAEEAVFKQVLQAVKDKETAEKTDVKVITLRKFRPYQRWWAAAACMVLLAGACWLSMRQSKRKAGIAGNEIAWVQVVNADEEVKKIVLPDNSHVTLNKGAHIRYQKIFKQKERIVELTGEAFFDVTHDSQKPFIVKSGNASTVVYGTAFNIQAYPGETQLAIALQRGKIGVRIIKQSEPAEEKILTPGQLYQYSNETGQKNITNIPAEQIGGWMQGGLSFYNTPLKDVLKQLERKFGVHFQLPANASLESTFTAYFPTATLQQVLNHLRFTSDLQFREKGKTVYIE